MGPHPYDDTWQCGVAFIPKTKSNCRNIGRKGPLGEEADDDGVAVFWRASRFTVDAIDFIAFDDVKRNEGAVRVKLSGVGAHAGESLTVIAAHLTSGDKPTDEISRMKEVRPLLRPPP